MKSVTSASNKVAAANAAHSRTMVMMRVSPNARWSLSARALKYACCHLSHWSTMVRSLNARAASTRYASVAATDGTADGPELADSGLTAAAACTAPGFAHA